MRKKVSILKKIRISLLVLLLVGLNLLNAATVIYFEYDPIADVTYKITEIDGIVVDIVEIIEIDDD